MIFLDVFVRNFRLLFGFFFVCLDGSSYGWVLFLGNIFENLRGMELEGRSVIFATKQIF